MSPAPTGEPSWSRDHSAISSVSRTSSVFIERAAFQPTIRRLKTSITKAT